MVKSGLDFFYFEILLAPSKLLLSSEKNLSRKAELAWQVKSKHVSLKGLVQFQTKDSRPLFTIIFKPKMLVSRPVILVPLFY